MTISKLFIQNYTSHDCEGRHWSWTDAKEDATYEELVERLASEWNGWWDGVRIVEKTFNDETFEITVKVIKTTRRTYKDWSWDGGVEEIVETE